MFSSKKFRTKTTSLKKTYCRIEAEQIESVKWGPAGRKAKCLQTRNSGDDVNEENEVKDWWHLHLQQQLEALRWLDSLRAEQCRAEPLTLTQGPRWFICHQAEQGWMRLR